MSVRATNRWPSGVIADRRRMTRLYMRMIGMGCPLSMTAIRNPRFMRRRAVLKELRETALEWHADSSGVPVSTILGSVQTTTRSLGRQFRRWE